MGILELKYKTCKIKILSGWTQQQNREYRGKKSEFEDRTVEIIQSKNQRENKGEKKEYQ